MKNLIPFGIFLLLTGCGGGANDSTSSDSAQTSTKLQYQFIENGCDTGQRTFDSKDAYCAALEDSRANGYCALEGRRQLFQERCGGTFQEVNGPQVNPDPRPQPNPQPSPPPPPPRPDLPKVVQDLAAAGIKVSIENEHLPTLPGEPQFSVRLAQFWAKLEAAEGLFLARKDRVHEILLSEYGAFNLPYQHVTLDVDMSTDDMTAYVSALDRITALDSRGGISFNPGVIEYGPRHDGLRDLNAKVAFAETNAQRLSGVVKEIKLGTTTMYSAYDRSLSLNYDTYATDFERLAKVLAASQPGMQLLDKLGIKIDSTSFIFQNENDGEAKAFAALNQAVAREKAAIVDLARSGFLEKISSSPGSDETTFMPSIKDLSLPVVDGQALRDLHPTLAALAEQALFSQATKIPFEYGYQGLKAEFLTASQHLSPLLGLLRGKAEKVRGVSFGEQSRFEYSNLTVGYGDSAADLRKAIESIK